MFIFILNLIPLFFFLFFLLLFSLFIFALFLLLLLLLFLLFMFLLPLFLLVLLLVGGENYSFGFCCLCQICLRQNSTKDERGNKIE